MPSAMSARFQRLRSWSSSRMICAVGVEPRRRARVLDQQQRQQTHHLGLLGEEAQQQAREADRLLAQRRADLRVAAGRRVALVEHQVDDRGDRGQARRALGRARRLERNLGGGDAALGARDPLLHRALADQERARDLLDRQPAHDAQRERDLLCRRQIRVAADEQQPQDVVAVVRAVEPLGQRRLGIAASSPSPGSRSSPGSASLLAAAAGVVDRGVAADEDQPGGRDRAAARSRASS